MLVKVPGVTDGLHGEMVVEGDPLTNFSDADRRARQALVMSVYTTAEVARRRARRGACARRAGRPT